MLNLGGKRHHVSVRRRRHRTPESQEDHQVPACRVYRALCMAARATEPVQRLRRYEADCCSSQAPPGTSCTAKDASAETVTTGGSFQLLELTVGAPFPGV